MSNCFVIMTTFDVKHSKQRCCKNGDNFTLNCCHVWQTCSSSGQYSRVSLPAVTKSSDRLRIPSAAIRTLSHNSCKFRLVAAGSGGYWPHISLFGSVVFADNDFHPSASIWNNLKYMFFLVEMRLANTTTGNSMRLALVECLNMHRQFCFHSKKSSIVLSAAMQLVA